MVSPHDGRGHTESADVTILQNFSQIFNKFKRMEISYNIYIPRQRNSQQAKFRRFLFWITAENGHKKIHGF